MLCTFGGNGRAGFSGDGGQATDAALNFATDIALDRLGNIFIADGNNNRVRKVNIVTGIITTIAGSGIGSYSGDGGPATNAEIWFPSSICLDTIVNFIYMRCQ